MNWLQTGCWAMNLFGLFFILAAHEVNLKKNKD
jgi:hypothetical protein